MSSPCLTSPCSFGSCNTNPYIVEGEGVFGQQAATNLKAQSSQIQTLIGRINSAHRLLVEASDPNRVSGLRLTYRGVIVLQILKDENGKRSLRDSDQALLTLGQQIALNAVYDELMSVMKVTQSLFDCEFENLEEALILSGRLIDVSLWLNEQALLDLGSENRVI